MTTKNTNSQADRDGLLFFVLCVVEFTPIYLMQKVVETAKDITATLLQMAIHRNFHNLQPKLDF